MTLKQTSAALLAIVIALTLSGCAASQSATNAPAATAPSSTTGGGAGASQPAAGASGSAALAQAGAQIFSTGNAADGSPLPVSAGMSGPCARCHGADAKGKIGPDIRWNVLTGTSSSANAPRFKLGSETDFTSAVTQGTAGGNQLRQMMPRYNLSADQVAALVAYLKTL